MAPWEASGCRDKLPWLKVIPPAYPTPPTWFFWPCLLLPIKGKPVFSDRGDFRRSAGPLIMVDLKEKITSPSFVLCDIFSTLETWTEYWLPLGPHCLLTGIYASFLDPLCLFLLRRIWVRGGESHFQFGILDVLLVEKHKELCALSLSREEAFWASSEACSIFPLFL